MIWCRCLEKKVWPFRIFYKMIRFVIITPVPWYAAVVYIKDIIICEEDGDPENPEKLCASFNVSKRKWLNPKRTEEPDAFVRGIKPVLGYFFSVVGV